MKKVISFILILFFTSNIILAQIPTDGLVAYYPFNGNANDESGNGLNLDIIGSPELVPDRFGNSNSAYDLDGINDSFYHDRNDLLLLKSESTFNVWIYNDGIDDDEDVIISTVDSPDIGGYQIALRITSNSIRLELRNPNPYRCDVTYSPSFVSKWIMITGVHDQNHLRLYVNGELQQELDANFEVNFEGSNNFRIGDNGHAVDARRLFNGIIDDIRIYDRALSESEIQELYGGNSKQFDATLNGITGGPAVSEIIVPANGKGYIYYSLTANSSPVNYKGEFSVTLKKSSTVFYSCEAKFIDQGVLRLTIPADALGSQESISFTLPDVIQISSNLYNIQGTPPTFTALLIPIAYTRTWDIFAGGSAGVSGLFGSAGAGASVSAAKLSVKGSGGVGFQIQLDESENLFLDRRMEFSVGVGVEAPSINTTVDQVNVEAGVKAEIISKTLIGQRFSFSGLSLDEDKKKMAQSGFMLETLSLGAMGISPIVGPLLRAVITTLNSTGGVENTFDDALITNYWGLGAEGKIGAGLGLDAGPLTLKAAEGGMTFALNARINTYHRIMPTALKSYLGKTPVVGKSVTITQAIGFNFSALSAGFKFNDGVRLNSDNLTLFDTGVGGEVSLGAYFNSVGNLDALSINLKGGGDVAIFANSRSTYYSTRIDIPGEYSPLIVDAGRGVAGLFVSGVNLPLGVDMVGDAVNSFKDTYTSLENNPLKVTTSETRGKGRSLNFGISLDAALGVGFGLSLGVNGKYFDEIEYPKKYSEVYTSGKNYLLYSTDYRYEMEEAELSEIMKDLFSGTVPLIKTAFLNIINKLEKIVEAGQTFVLNVVNTGQKVVGKIGGAVSNSGKWVVSVFSPNTPMVLTKAFEQPRTKQMYYSTNVKHKAITADSKITTVDIETILVIVSESMNVSFTPDATGEPIDSVDTPIEVKMVIDEQKLLENDFAIEDKERIKIYRYDINSLSWILEGGTLIDDTLKTNTANLGTFALGIELTNEVDNTPPEIFEKGPQQGSTQDEYPEIYGIIRDDTYGFGIDLSSSMIILNNDTLNISYDPTNEKIYYKLSAQDSIDNGPMDVTIVAADLAGNSVQETFSFQLNITDVEDNNLLKDYKLYQNYPNPFNPSTVIQFNLPERTNVTINIYDIQGRYVTTVFSGELQSGTHKVKWNGLNNRGQKVSSGIYFYQFKTDKMNIVKKMQLLK